MDYLNDWHRWAAEGLLIVLFINLAIPYFFKGNMPRTIFWTRIGYFAFWAFWTMTAFDGLVTWIFAQRMLPTRVVVMILVTLILPFLDGYRSIKLRKLWLADQGGNRFNSTIVVVEIALTIIALLYGLYGK